MGEKLQSLVASRSEGKPVRGMGRHGLEWGREEKKGRGGKVKDYWRTGVVAPGGPRRLDVGEDMYARSAY